MKLTITASNKNRLQLNHNPSEFFIKSIQWQTYDDFELLIADGGSDNYEELKEYLENYDGKIPMRIVQHKIDDFSRSFLNNVGIVNAKGEYVGTTDVDMMFGKDFFKVVTDTIGHNVFVESRTMYWKKGFVSKIYKEELDLYEDLEACKKGRIKKRTSCGGFQCTHIDNWRELRGFDQRYKIWGSEDQDVLKRAKMCGLKIKWLGESNDVMLFHQPHPKPNIKIDLEYQEKNKKFLNNIKTHKANPDGWGGVYDE